MSLRQKLNTMRSRHALAARVMVGKKEWDAMSTSEMTQYVEDVFTHYRSVGFPHYRLTAEEKRVAYDKFCAFDVDTVLQEMECMVVRQTMHALALCWSYFPHAWEIRCSNSMTPLEAFNDDDKLRAVIRKRIKFGTYMTDSGLRKSLRMHTGVQAVSNFRPTAARAIYTHFGARNVWDMSCGFGGRLLGAAAAGVKSYVGTEPATPTFLGLRKLSRDFSGSMRVKLHKKGSEVFCPKRGSVDLCFTSPPYFDCERYSEERTQSFKAFPTKEVWLEGFLFRTFENCRTALRKGGHMVINIADTKTATTLAKDAVACAKAAGFEHTDTWKLALSLPLGSARRVSFKYEPIFVFTR